MCLCGRIYKRGWHRVLISFFWLTFFSLRLIPSYRDRPYLFNIFFDQLRISMVILTFLISGLILMARKKVVIENQKPAYLLLLVVALRYILVEAYLVSDLFCFYIFFEASLIPTFIIILS